jgi:hypothetical protein
MTEDKEKAKAYITGIISDYYSDAKKQLLMEELDLGDSIEYKRIQKSEGIETKIEAMLQ